MGIQDYILKIDSDPVDYGTLAEMQAKGYSEALILSAYKVAAKLMIAENAYSKEMAGTTWNTYPVYTDHHAQQRINDVYTMSKNGLWIDGKVFKFADGVPRPMTSVEIEDLTTTVISYVQNIGETEAIKIAQIDSATTLAEVDAINLTF
jgi:hypothetical protein